MSTLADSQDDTANRIRWANAAQTVLLVDFTLPLDRNTVTLEERVQILYEAAALAQTVDHSIDVILDLRQARIMPKGNWLTAVRGINETTPTNIRQVIVVGSHHAPLLNKILATIASFQSLRINAVFVRTMKEARELLAAPK